MPDNATPERVALVTGGGSGIGLAITQEFLDTGVRVAIAQRTPVEIPGAEYFSADVSDPAQCENLVHSVFGHFERLDILINNAGTMQESSAETTQLDDWNRTMAVNLTAPFVLIKHAIAYLRQVSGNIVNIGSIEGFSANPGHAAYCASKSGLHGLTRAVAVDHGTEGIRCNAVAPGWIDTDFNERFIAARSRPERFRERLAGIHPVGRTGLPEEVASLVVWLASDQASFVTGQVYTVDGGRMIQPSLADDTGVVGPPS